MTRFTIWSKSTCTLGMCTTWEGWDIIMFKLTQHLWLLLLKHTHSLLNWVCGPVVLVKMLHVSWQRDSGPTQHWHTKEIRRLNFIIIISMVTITNDCWKVVKSVKPCKHSLSYLSQREDISYHTMHNSFGFGSGCVKGQLTSHHTPTPSGLVLSHSTTKLSNLETTNF